MLQVESLRVRFPMLFFFFKSSYPSSRRMIDSAYNRNDYEEPAWW
jgi:hypothetical protein